MTDQPYDFTTDPVVLRMLEKFPVEGFFVHNSRVSTLSAYRNDHTAPASEDDAAHIILALEARLAGELCCSWIEWSMLPWPDGEVTITIFVEDDDGDSEEFRFHSPRLKAVCEALAWVLKQEK